MIPPSEHTILWSTQGGRAKACARRTSRILRDYYSYYQENEHSSSSSSSSGGGSSGNTYNDVVDTNYYGTSFDDYGALDFLKLGTTTNTNTNNNNNNKRLLIMFVSTTGDAEHCDCIQDTWKILLQKSLPSDQFTNVTFALFCLGDRAYGPTAFCAAGRKLATRLTQLGAKLFCNIGYGDDGTASGGVFYDLDQWIDKQFIPCILNGVNGGTTTTTTGGGGGGSRNRIPKDAIMNMSQKRKPESPYQVISSSSSSLKGEDDKMSLDNQSSTKEECQMPTYRTSYNNFFASLCPATAYQYNVTDGSRMLDIEGNNKNNDDDDNDDVKRYWPLIGHVTSNKRLTSKEWVQDTRHIQICVESQTSTDFNLTNGNSNTNEDKTMSTNTHTKVPLPYMAGDIATIIPSNTKPIVKKFLSCLPQSIQAKADSPLSIMTKIIPSTQYTTSYTPWPANATLRGILTFCADISSLPEREDLRSLSAYCNLRHPVGIDQKTKLISLSETTNAALYGDYVIREKRNWADVLFDFDSIQFEEVEEEGDYKNNHDHDHDMSSFTPLNIEQLLMILSPIMPRHFSIASAPTTSIVKGNESGYVKTMGKRGFDLDLCVAVVKGSTRHGRQYKGLCSNYLSHQGTTVKQSNLRLWIRPGSFNKLPLDMDIDKGPDVESGFPRFTTPIMCIGAGTGIAPLRSLIHEREAIRSQLIYSIDGHPVKCEEREPKDNIIVFGCRKEKEDYYYKDEWQSICTDGPSRVITAFSQDQKRKIYVQQVIRDADEGLLIAKHILENSGAVYVAGGAKMARAVKDVIIDCLGKHLPDGNSDAQKLLQRLQRVGKFSIEAWS